MNNNNHQLPPLSAKRIITAATQEVKKQIIRSQQQNKSIHTTTTQAPALPSQSYPHRRGQPLPVRGGGGTPTPSNPSEQWELPQPSSPTIQAWELGRGGGATVAAASVAPSQLPPTVAGADVSGIYSNHTDDRTTQGVLTKSGLENNEGAYVGNGPVDTDTLHVSQHGTVIDLEKCTPAIRDVIEEMKKRGGPLRQRFAEAAQRKNDGAWGCTMGQGGIVDYFWIVPQYLHEFAEILHLDNSEFSNTGSVFRKCVKWWKCMKCFKNGKWTHGEMVGNGKCRNVRNV